MGNEASKVATDPREKHEEIEASASASASVPSDAAPTWNDAINSFSSVILSRLLFLHDMTTWIQCQNNARKPDMAEMIEQKWQAEHRAGANGQLHLDELELLKVLNFPFITSKSTEHEILKCVPVISNAQNEITRAKAKWNLDAAEWINSERNVKQKSQHVLKWETTQQEEFHKWVSSTKDSNLESNQVTFLQAVGFPLSRDLNFSLNNNNTSSAGNNKKQPRRSSTDATTATSKRAKQDSGSPRARTEVPSTPRRDDADASTSGTHTLAMDEHLEQRDPSKKGVKRTAVPPKPSSTAGDSKDPLELRLEQDESLRLKLILTMALQRPRQPKDHNPPNRAFHTKIPSTVIAEGFNWKEYPILENVLYEHMEEYYEWSTREPMTKHQQAFNNALAEKVRNVGCANGTQFDPIHFTDKRLRDRIRCFYKTRLQNAKRRLGTLLMNIHSEENRASIELLIQQAESNGTQV